MAMPAEPFVLRAALGAYPHTAALRDGRVTSDRLRLDFAEVSPVNRAFAPMVREGRFDVSELAIATALQAKAYDKPIVLLPLTVAACFQEAALLCRTDGDVHRPADLAGRRIGVRSYSQTTGMWLRGILADEYGVRPESMRWPTFEDAHITEAQDPPWAERAPADKDLLAMLRAGELDAVIVGNDVPDDPNLRTVFPNPAAAGAAFLRRHGFVPVNHMVVVRRRAGRRSAGPPGGAAAAVPGRQGRRTLARRRGRSPAGGPRSVATGDRARLALCL
jgi:4,5-dihydroxyphthalate decarboxylase